MKCFLFLIIVFRFCELVKTDKTIEVHPISNQNLQFDIAGLFIPSRQLYMFKVNNRNNRAKREICYNLSSDVFIVSFEHISHLVLVFLLFTLSR